MTNLVCSDSDYREAWLFQSRVLAANNQALQTWELGSETAEPVTESSTLCAPGYREVEPGKAPRCGREQLNCPTARNYWERHHPRVRSRRACGES